MSQVSYGTITITDTNDIESITVEYNRNQSSSSAPSATDSGWSTTRPNWEQGYYIWQRTRVHKSGTTADQDVIGTAVCITGSTGSTGAPGRGLTNTATQYCNYGAGEPANDYEDWVNAPPTYDSSKPNYWVKITNTYSAAPTPEIIKYKDEALTKTVSDSAIANSVAQHASEDAQGAMAQSASNISEVKRIWFLKNVSGAPDKPTSSTTIYDDNAANHWTTIRPTVTGYRYYYYCEQTTTGGGIKSWSDVYLDLSEFSEYEIGAMKTRFQSFFYPGDSNYPGAYAVGKSTSDGLDVEDISTYGYNLRLTPTALSIGYNAIKAIEIDGATPALKFYKPSKTSQGAQTAQLDAKGLVLSEGGIESGSVTSGNGYIYLSTADKGSVVNTLVPTPSGGTPKTNWRAVIGSKFGVDSDGNLYANNATISGAITATSLTLGTGVKLNAETDINNLASVATTGSYNDLSNKPTIPSLTGYIHTDGTIGSTAAEGANSFTVASSGALTASNAIIYGTLYASKGYVGGWRIGTDGNKSLHNGTTDTSPTINNNTIILSKGLTSTTSVAGSTGEQTWTIVAGTNFGVTTGGKLYATGAEISGDLTASSFKINGTNYINQIPTISDKADSADSNWTVLITTTGTPDYVTPSVTLKATVYHEGIVTTNGFTRAWYKNGMGNSLGSGETITVTDIDAFYTCIIS